VSDYDDFLELWNAVAAERGGGVTASGVDDDGRVWYGDDLLRQYLVPIHTLTLVPNAAAGDPDTVRDALVEYGQIRPVLVGDLGTDVVMRQHLVEAAIELGWTQVAVRLKISEDATDSRDQMTFIEDLERRDDKPENHADLIATLARPPGWREADQVEVDGINLLSMDTSVEWVGLPEFARYADPAFAKIIVSVMNEKDRDALLDVLGIQTIHKGTRGTLSVWWPPRGKRDLKSCLRFVDTSDDLDEVVTEVDE